MLNTMFSVPKGNCKYIFALAVFLQTFSTNSLAESIPQTDWSLLSVDSEELVGENGAAVNAFDGDVNTTWATSWFNDTTTVPHNIDISLGGSYELNGFRYLPRQDGGDNGRINQYEFYVSSDGVNWGTPAASGNFADSAAEQEALFAAPERGAFVRLVALSSYDGDPWTTVAEITVLGDPASGNQPPDSIIDAPGSDLAINVGDSLNFTATSSDPDGDLPLTYLWSFGAGSGIPDAYVEDPGSVQFDTEGIFNVSFTVTDSLGLDDPTPAIRTITVGNQAPDGSIDTPATDLTINVGDALNFTATSSDPDGDLPLTYLWNFGAGLDIPDAYVEDPGSVQFNTAGSFTVSFTVTDALGLADPIPDLRIITVRTTPPQLIPQTGWSLLSVDSEELVGEDGAAVNAFDGDVNTTWTTSWFNDTTTVPHNIDISLGGSYQLDGFRYLPRQDGGDNGRINQYEFYVSSDGVNWGTPAAGGNFADSAAEQEALFAAPGTGAFVRLVALSSYDGDPWTTVAEITVLGDLASGNQPPDSIIDAPGSDLAINVGDSLNFTATSSDPDGDLPLTYLWNFGAGPDIPDAYVEDPGSVQFNTEGVFVVSFTVTDSLGLDDPTPAIRTITVGNQAPDGSIDTPATDLTINVGDSLNFTATSSDPDGDLPLTYLWNFGAGLDIPDAYVEDPGSVQFNTAGSFTVSFTVTDALGLADPIPDLRIITVRTTPPQLIPQTGWSLLSVDSEELVGEDGAAVNAFDGDVNTTWTTSWFNDTTTVPHNIDISLGGSYQLDGFRYLPRQDGGDNGRINQYEFYVSSDGVNWGTPAAGGNFADSAAEQEALFAAPETGAFVRLVALSSYDGDPWTTVAEITVLGDLASGNQPPDSIIDAPGSDLAINVGDSLNFTATSSDPDGDLPLTYLWNFGAGPDIPDAYVEDPGSVQFNTEGVFVVSFTVTDSLGLDDPTPAIRTITVGNQAPDGSIDTPATDLTINVGDSLNFTATSSDPDGDLPLTYLWNFGAGLDIPDAYVEDPGSVQFNTAGSFTVSFTVTDALGLADPIPDLRIITVRTTPPQLIPQTGWSLLSVDSEELVGEDGAAVNAFDGDVNTTWTTSWFNDTTTVPHNIDISLGGSYQLDGFRYLPRQDGGDNGRINQYEFYVSSDGVNWGTPAASGNFADSAAEQEALFAAPETGAFVRLVALSSYDGDPWTTVAEITVLGDLASGNQAPDGIIDTPGSDLTINVGDSLNFTATSSDPDGDLPLTYLWNFGAGPDIPDAYVEDPGSVQFNTEGIFNVSFTVTDALGLYDSTPENRMITVCTAPSVLLLKPNDLYIQSSADLYVAADTCLDSTLHAGWGVRFTVTDSSNTMVATFDDFSAPYEANFTGLNQDEHTVDVTILDQFGSEFSGFNTSDQATQIGIGDYYVAFGDSITRGLGDDILSDDTSLDGRNLLGGYTPILNDLLTTANGYPHTVINKGNNGYTARDGLLLLPSILANNSEAQYYLIMFGTNDAGQPVPSGLGLIEGQTGYIGSYKDTVNQIITLINNAGKTAYLAKIPYAKNYENRNILIQEYNLVIDDLVLEHDISITPPDFYTFFFNNQDQYSDSLHPNGTGYQSVANIWFNLLSP